MSFSELLKYAKNEKKNCGMLNSIRVKYLGFIVYFSVATLLSIHQRYLQT